MHSGVPAHKHCMLLVRLLARSFQCRQHHGLCLSTLSNSAHIETHLGSKHCQPTQHVAQQQQPEHTVGQVQLQQPGLLLLQDTCIYACSVSPAVWCCLAEALLLCILCLCCCLLNGHIIVQLWLLLWLLMLLLLLTRGVTLCITASIIRHWLWQLLLLLACMRAHQAVLAVHLGAVAACEYTIASCLLLPVVVARTASAAAAGPCCAVAGAAGVLSHHQQRHQQLFQRRGVVNIVSIVNANWRLLLLLLLRLRLLVLLRLLLVLRLL